MFTDQLLQGVERVPLHALDAIAKSIWSAMASGAISEAEAEGLAAAVEARRVAAKASVAPKPPRPPRPLQRRPEAWERRRRLAASGPLPPALAAKFTVGELAALRIVADECRDHGSCQRTVGEIATRAGVGNTTVQNALREAQRFGLLTVTQRRRPGRPSLPNLVEITSREWRIWISRGPKERVQETTGLSDKIQKNSFNAPCSRLHQTLDDMNRLQIPISETGHVKGKGLAEAASWRQRHC